MSYQIVYRGEIIMLYFTALSAKAIPFSYKQYVTISVKFRIYFFVLAKGNRCTLIGLLYIFDFNDYFYWIKRIRVHTQTVIQFTVSSITPQIKVTI